MTGYAPLRSCDPDILDEATRRTMRRHHIALVIGRPCYGMTGTTWLRFCHNIRDEYRWLTNADRKIAATQNSERQEVSPAMVFQCTAEHPWDRKSPGPVTHHGAHEIGDQQDGYPGGDIVTYECRHCGHRWQTELPQ